MPGWPKLSKPPIQEAILNIGLNLPESISYDALKQFFKVNLSDKTLIIQPKFSINLQAKVENNAHNFTSDQKEEGFLIIYAEGKRVIQFTSNNLSFHIIESYRDWKDFIEEAQSIFKSFLETFPDFNVKYLSVRYLNRLELPSDFLTGFQNYLKVLPILPDGINAISNFFLQIVMPFEGTNMKGKINQTLEQPESNKLIKVMLDVEVLKDVENFTSTQDIWLNLSEMREYKNKLFFGSITNKTVKLYEE